MSPEVVKKLDEIDEKMMEIKRELHLAKSQCIKDLTRKFESEIKSAKRTFVDEKLLEKAINGEKVTGWNNS